MSRNPYYRLFSAYKSKILNHLDTQYAGTRDAIRSANDYPIRDGLPAGMVTFRDFVKFVEDTPDVSRDFHWATQTALLCRDVIDYNVIGRVETFEDDFRGILRTLNAPDDLLARVSDKVNPTTRIHHAAAYDHDLAARVFEIYRGDFETLGYEKDSWLFDF